MSFYCEKQKKMFCLLVLYTFSRNYNK